MSGHVRDLSLVRRIAAAAVVAFLVLVVAVTPLSAVVEPGHFELFVPPVSTTPGWDWPTTFDLDDHTGLVSGFVFTDSNPGTVSSSRLIVVPWEGDSCGASVSLWLLTNGDRYTVNELTQARSCSIGVGLSVNLGLVLRAPIDPSKIEIVQR